MLYRATDLATAYAVAAEIRRSTLNRYLDQLGKPDIELAGLKLWVHPGAQIHICNRSKLSGTIGIAVRQLVEQFSDTRCMKIRFDSVIGPLHSLSIEQ